MMRRLRCDGVCSHRRFIPRHVPFVQDSIVVFVTEQQIKDQGLQLQEWHGGSIGGVRVVIGIRTPQFLQQVLGTKMTVQTTAQGQSCDFRLRDGSVGLLGHNVRVEFFLKDIVGGCRGDFSWTATAHSGDWDERIMYWSGTKGLCIGVGRKDYVLEWDERIMYWSGERGTLNREASRPSFYFGGLSMNERGTLTSAYIHLCLLWRVVLSQCNRETAWRYNSRKAGEKGFMSSESSIGGDWWFRSLGQGTETRF